ncbi:hypothetical protein [Kribbella sp. NPDC051620]|uniref:hypothetical protein n=1 Tax=Kribbella sp. NPDC051620 TaxID=3364120 RepID=UPI0037B7FA06
MNLEDLRAHLTDQAGEVDPTSALPLPAIRRRRTTLLRRRAATVITTAAVAIALIAVVLPNAINTSTPPPAEPPADYTRDGITIPGTVGADRLTTAAVGKNFLTSTWTPTSDSVTFRMYCRPTTGKPKTLTVTLNDRVLLERPCNDTGHTPVQAISLPPDDIHWPSTPIGTAAHITFQVRQTATGEFEYESAQVALGIYTTPTVGEGATEPSFPGGPADYVKDGVRYRAKVAGDTLAAATVGELGQTTLKLSFATASTAQLGLRMYCAVPAGRPGVQYLMKLRTSAGTRGSAVCDGQATDAGAHGDIELPDHGTPGKTIEVEVTLIDVDGRPVDLPKARLGVGAYLLQPRHLISDVLGNKISLPATREFAGSTYALTHLEQVDAAHTHQVSVPLPAGQPFLLAYGSSTLGADMDLSATLTGLGPEVTLEPSGGRFSTVLVNQRERAATTATFALTEGRPRHGKLYLAVYVPE